MKFSKFQYKASHLSAIMVAGCILTACGGGGDAGSSIGTVNFPSVRSLPGPSGVSQLSSANDALVWARTGNTAVDFNELINITGLGLFNAFLSNFSSTPVGTSFGSNSCASGFVNIERLKQSAADISVGDYYQVTYNACNSSGFTFNGTIRAQLVGVLASGSVGTRYSATSFGYVENATSVSYSGITAVVNHAFNSTLSAYSATGTIGTYFSPSAGTLTQNGSYTINNAVVSSTLSGSLVTGKRFGMDVVQGVLNLKLDTETPLTFSGSTLTSGDVQILSSTHLSRVRVSPNGGNSRVNLDASNDGSFESFVDTTGQLVF
jgi:hypothetical protein